MSEDTIRNFLGFFLLALLGSFGSIVSPVLPQYAEQLGASHIEVGLFFSAYSFTWALLQLFTGYLSDKYGRKRFVMFGLSIYGLSLIFSGLSQNFTQLVIFRVLQGVELGLFYAAYRYLRPYPSINSTIHSLRVPNDYCRNNFYELLEPV